MSMEDSMADDSNQTPSPAPAFGQASSGTPPVSCLVSATPTPPTTVQPPGFLFGAQTNQPQPQVQAPSQSPFPATQFSAGGSFSLGSGGDDKSNRRIVRVKDRPGGNDKTCEGVACYGLFRHSTTCVGYCGS
ncbi:hypothetical protein HanIR_Chr07g0324561 [Helianthus annuus]|nr:hypothetical protein HanIR_Chr07g0324561 [Helianthus annuus]